MTTIGKTRYVTSGPQARPCDASHLHARVFRGECNQCGKRERRPGRGKCDACGRFGNAPQSGPVLAERSDAVVGTPAAVPHEPDQVVAVCPNGVLPDVDGVPPALLARCNVEEVMRLAEVGPPDRPVTILGRLLEVHADPGRPLWTWLMQQPNSADGGAPFLTAWTELEGVLKAKTVAPMLLVPSPLVPVTAPLVPSSPVPESAPPEPEPDPPVPEPEPPVPEPEPPVPKPEPPVPEPKPPVAKSVLPTPPVPVPAPPAPLDEIDTPPDNAIVEGRDFVEFVETIQGWQEWRFGLENAKVKRLCRR